MPRQQLILLLVVTDSAFSHEGLAAVTLRARRSPLLQWSITILFTA